MEWLNKQYIFHLPGEGKKNIGYLLNKWKPINILPQITIVTIATPNIINKCPLIDQLTTSNITFINGADFYNINEEWKKIDKLPLICEALKQVQTEYVLLLDANDVIILKDIDNEFIKKWKEFDAEMVYNASEHLYPKLFAHPDEIKRTVLPFVQHYLNAGVAFGKTEYAKNIYQEAYRQSQRDEFAPFDSEQYYIRIAWLMYKKIKLDIHSKLFLLSHGN